MNHTTLVGCDVKHSSVWTLLHSEDSNMAIFHKSEVFEDEIRWKTKAVGKYVKGKYFPDVPAVYSGCHKRIALFIYFTNLKVN